MTPVRPEVKRGAKVLDAYFGHKLWDERVNIDSPRFDVADGEWCVLGRAFTRSRHSDWRSGYTIGICKLAEWSVEHEAQLQKIDGEFSVAGYGFEWSPRCSYRTLTADWRRLIKQRRAARVQKAKA
jgi:hypothetical protein